MARRQRDTQLLIGAPPMLSTITRIIWAIIALLGHPTEWDRNYP